MNRSVSNPSALTIAGSDSGGGAGIQADLKTFAALGVHGTSAITCVTAQNLRAVTAVQPVRPAVVRAQIDAVFDGFTPLAIKTGMLFSKALIKAVVESLEARPLVPLVVDPVMIATSGAELLRADAVTAMKRLLLPRATLITPNLDEAAFLFGSRLNDVEDMRSAARSLHREYGCAVLLKGGHLKGGREAVDIYFDGREELLLTAPYVKRVSTHGTGCTFSAAIAAHLALGCSLPVAVGRAKEYISRAIAQSRRVRGSAILNHFHS